MCGIVGYIGERKEVKSILFNGLSKLEYRGYDSAGISILKNGNIITKKAVGKLVNLEKEIINTDMKGFLGIGHTRWATHGKPSVENSHPHLSTNNDITLVHNGIIENYDILKAALIKKGHKFLSQTDTEVIVHLIEDAYEGDIFEAVKKILPLLDGAYAIGVFTKNEPNKLIAARKGSPLVIGVGKNENFIASDIPAILEHTKDAIFLNDGEIAILTKNSVEIFDLNGDKTEKNIKHIEWSLEAAEKGGYDHFMIKEIHEQDRVINDTLRGKVFEDNVKIDEITMSDEELQNIHKIHIVACGTSWHAGLVGKYILEQELRIPVEVEVASEFRYKNPIISNKDLVILISQSGETADTLAGLREAKSKGAKTLGILNVVGSTISREADGTIYTNAGPEIGVASTKAFVSQLIALYILMLFLGEKKNILSKERRKYIISELKLLSKKVKTILNNEKNIEKIAKLFENVNSTMFIGRNINAPIALEGALKLKEISYIHAEGYPSGELKHGPIALIHENFPTVAIATKSHTYEKVKNNVEEIKARSGTIITIASEGDEKIQDISDAVLYVPDTEELFSPVINVIPLQILSYYVAKSRGLDVDKPRNLAKSVTVE
ncbi:glutamine--fructose-6-phosphate transaminase [Hypnocyclicus thermotrophus]|uniref:Glutamine--fructose-6-phosphate aminotransferase [isomerizing] n=1 Tax=Hypnocyclicus thermotrophus TaxID=1627895 RepID=A0AA46DXE0_9FUSO|nr:glutamine--fructose-6-phosphate transaminase (isomerizing) [Hypnocyclicus thermotrophus]TDT68033.1 glutamine--fructose-6-phosphate transaminase [Hypnocyclicus thermotrophus]